MPLEVFLEFIMPSVSGTEPDGVVAMGTRGDFGCYANIFGLRLKEHEVRFARIYESRAEAVTVQAFMGPGWYGSMSSQATIVSL
jgi:hypothetical protein